MRRSIALWSMAGVVSLVPVAAVAAQGEVEAVGEAMVANGDVVAAKRAAVADALKKCIEQVVGITIRSDFSAEQREVVKNNESDFYSKVRDSLVQKSEGFIQKYDILDERRDGDVLKVRVRAVVYESKLRAEVVKLADLIAAAGNPKLMLVIQEVYVDPNGNERLAAESLVGAQLEKELLARGFELRGQREARVRASQGVDAYDRWLEDLSAVAAEARKNGADILIAGRVEIRDKGEIKDAGALTALRGQRRVELTSVVRGLNSATGEVFSTKPVQMRSVGTTVERAVHRALHGRGSNLIRRTFDELLEDLKTSFRKTADLGTSFVVEVSGIRSFRRQGKPFMDLLRSVRGVTEVKQDAYHRGALSVSLRCKCTVDELQNRIFEVAGARFGTLDVESVSGKKLSLKL